jgi:opacity protein-like surface antigen
MYWLAKTSQKRRLSLSKLTIRIIPLLVLLLLAGVKQASAQGVSAYFGVGSATDSAGTSAGCASGQLFDEFTGNCEPGPTIGGVFGVFGADFMIKPSLGVNAEYSFRFAQAPYLPAAGLNMRPGFYDFNAVYEPLNGLERRFVPEFVGGIGGARIALYIAQNCTITGISCSSSTPAGINANHFQVHLGAGLKIYVKGNLFIKPQFDLHYVTNLTDQFGRNWVPQYTGSIGYTFGGR